MSAFLRIRAANVFNVLKTSASLQFGSASRNAVENNQAINFRNVSTKGEASSQGRTRVNPFSMKGVIKHPELIPLVGIIFVAMAGVGGYSVYSCFTRNDVQFRRQGEYSTMDLQKPPVLKLKKTIDYKEYKPLTTLESLYKEMESAEEKQKRE